MPVNKSVSKSKNKSKSKRVTTVSRNAKPKLSKTQIAGIAAATALATAGAGFVGYKVYKKMSKEEAVKILGVPLKSSVSVIEKSFNNVIQKLRNMFKKGDLNIVQAGEQASKAEEACKILKKDL